MLVHELRRGDWVIDGEDIGEVDIDLTFAPHVRMYVPSKNHFVEYNNKSLYCEVTKLDPAVADIMKGIVNANNNE